MFPICFFVPGIWSRTASNMCLGDGVSLSDTPSLERLMPAGRKRQTHHQAAAPGRPLGASACASLGGPTENSGHGGQRDAGSPGLASITPTVADSELN